MTISGDRRRAKLNRHSTSHGCRSLFGRGSSWNAGHFSDGNWIISWCCASECHTILGLLCGNRCELISKQISWDSGVKGIRASSLLWVFSSLLHQICLFLLQTLLPFMVLFFHTFIQSTFALHLSIFAAFLPLLVIFHFISSYHILSPSLSLIPLPVTFPLPPLLWRSCSWMLIPAYNN